MFLKILLQLKIEIIQYKYLCINIILYDYKNFINILNFLRPTANNNEIKIYFFVIDISLF